MSVLVALDWSYVRSRNSGWLAVVPDVRLSPRLTNLSHPCVTPVE